MQKLERPNAFTPTAQIELVFAERGVNSRNGSLDLIPPEVGKVSQNLAPVPITPFRLTVRNLCLSKGNSFNFLLFQPFLNHVHLSSGSYAK